MKCRVLYLIKASALFPQGEHAAIHNIHVCRCRRPAAAKSSDLQRQILLTEADIADYITNKTGSGKDSKFPKIRCCTV